MYNDDEHFFFNASVNEIPWIPRAILFLRLKWFVGKIGRPPQAPGIKRINYHAKRSVDNFLLGIKDLYWCLSELLGRMILFAILRGIGDLCHRAFQRLKGLNT